MESATFETLGTAVTFSVLILGTSENPQNVTSLQQFWYPPLIHPLGQPQPQPWRRVLRTIHPLGQPQPQPWRRVLRTMYSACYTSHFPPAEITLRSLLPDIFLSS